MGGARTGSAQQPSTTPAAAARVVAPDTTVTPDSPRAALRDFFDAAGSGDFAHAARFLDAPATGIDRAADLARQLKLVLDQYAWLDLTTVSPAAQGDTADGLPRGVDQVAAIDAPGIGREPVRLRRSSTVATADSTAPSWRFSRATVERIPVWYATLGNRWLVDHLPSALLRAGPLDVAVWQWLAIVPLLIVALVLGIAAARLLRQLLRWLTRRSRSDVDDMIVSRLARPLTAATALAVLAALLPLLELYAPGRAAAFRAIKAAYAVVFFWALWRAIDVGRQFATHTRWATTTPASRSLIPLGARTIKVLVGVLALMSMLSILGYPVTSLIAGLGIGGLALALAAQKTVENLFGAFSIGIDQPFREGDFVHVDDFVGTVEAIGLRSTRFRTLDRTLITLPNGRLADMRLESFAVRDRLRLALTVGLVYETTAAQMRTVLQGLERVLRSHPLIWPDAVVVRFGELAPSSLNIDVMAWFQTSDWGEFQTIRQDVLLQFMDVVERAGTSFAFPTSTVHLASMPALPSPMREHVAEARRG